MEDNGPLSQASEVDQSIVLTQAPEKLTFHNSNNLGSGVNGSFLSSKYNRTSHSTVEQAQRILEQKGEGLKDLASNIKRLRVQNDSVLLSNLEVMKSIQQPELGVTGAIFKSNYTPIAQYQSLHLELNKTYKANRGIEKGFDHMTPKITNGENVFQKKRLLNPRFHSTVTTGYNESSLFMTSLLKNSKGSGHPNETTINNYSIIEEAEDQSMTNLLKPNEDSLVTLKDDMRHNLLMLPELVSNSLQQHERKEDSKRVGGGGGSQQLANSKTKTSIHSNRLSNDEVKRDPFIKPFILPVYQAGTVLLKGDSTKRYIEVDVNQWKKKYYLYGRQKEHLENESLIKLQGDFFKQVIMEILEYCSDEFHLMSLRTLKRQGSNQVSLHRRSISTVAKGETQHFSYLFTNTGQRIKNIVDISEDVLYLVVSLKNEFDDIDRREQAVDHNIENRKSIKRKVLQFLDSTNQEY